MLVNQVLILCLSTKARHRSVMTESKNKNYNGDCAKYATEADGAIIRKHLK